MAENKNGAPAETPDGAALTDAALADAALADAVGGSIISTLKKISPKGYCTKGDGSVSTEDESPN